MKKGEKFNHLIAIEFVVVTKNINRRIDNYGWSIEKALTIQL